MNGLSIGAPAPWARIRLADAAPADGSSRRDALCHIVCIDPRQYRQIALSPFLPRFLLERKNCSLPVDGSPYMNTATSTAYSYKVVRQFAIMTVVWGIVGMGLGVFIAAQLAPPFLNFDLPWTSFGRLRPLHTNAVISPSAAVLCSRLPTTRFSAPAKPPCSRLSWPRSPSGAGSWSSCSPRSPCRWASPAPRNTRNWSGRSTS